MVENIFSNQIKSAITEWFICGTIIFLLLKLVFFCLWTLKKCQGKFEKMKSYWKDFIRFKMFLEFPEYAMGSERSVQSRLTSETVIVFGLIWFWFADWLVFWWSGGVGWFCFCIFGLVAGVDGFWFAFGFRFDSLCSFWFCLWVRFSFLCRFSGFFFFGSFFGWNCFPDRWTRPEIWNSDCLSNDKN